MKPDLFDLRRISAFAAIKPRWLVGAAALVGTVIAPAATPALGPGVMKLCEGAGAVFARDQRILWVDPANTGDRLARLFERVGHRLDDIQATGRVQRILLADLPADLGNIPVAAERKRLFVSVALPLILQVNETIMGVRARIIGLRDQAAAGHSLSRGDRHWLSSMVRSFNLDELDYDELLAAVDIIPPSLALAQAAEESGWGTSRFARDGNALFGQRTYSQGHPGMVPSELGPGASFRVRKFDSLLSSVASYAHNLNSHHFYGEFRRARAEMRRAGGAIHGSALVGTLRRYSERGSDYIESLRLIIRVNRFQRFDTAAFI